MAKATTFFLVALLLVSSHCFASREGSIASYPNTFEQTNEVTKEDRVEDKIYNAAGEDDETAHLDYIYTQGNNNKP
ncbi:Phytosulfokines 3 [Striga hermonthica]|uniref:Phytosulfokines 3 n=1 Tax=Striga hermonthica TaxID=68872 RepID=A0A9N7NP80_STRHE|nr:Phytosulfokines 3 [Striga hermonthica]